LPKTIECELKENLVNVVIVGDVVIMNGILKTETIMEDKKGNIYKGRKMAQGQLVCFMDVNSVVFQKNMKKHQLFTNEEFIFSENELKIFDSLAKDREIFPLMIKSFCPTN